MIDYMNVKVPEIIHRLGTGTSIDDVRRAIEAHISPRVPLGIETEVSIQVMSASGGWEITISYRGHNQYQFRTYFQLPLYKAARPHDFYNQTVGPTS